MNCISHIPTEMILPLCLPNYSHPPPPQRRRARHRVTTALSVLKISRPVSEIAVDEVFQDFVRERELNGDVISKISDRIWLRNVANFDSVEVGSRISEITLSEEVTGNDNEGGFLKLKSTKEWLSGDAMAPVNKKRTLKEIQDDRERRKRLNFLRYEAVRSESEYEVKICRIFVRSVKGSSIALSSPRLVIPAAIYGLWELSQHFAHDLFDFQLVPAMVGLFVYKAACLVQVYRDNEDLQFLFPENEEGSRD
ncbi:unnamed protein product [Withania somnifera]